MTAARPGTLYRGAVTAHPPRKSQENSVAAARPCASQHTPALLGLTSRVPYCSGIASARLLHYMHAFGMTTPTAAGRLPLLLLACCGPVVRAFPSYRDLIPNGLHVPQVAAAGALPPAVLA